MRTWIAVLLAGAAFPALADQSIWIGAESLDISAKEVIDGQGATAKIGFDFDFLQRSNAAFRLSGTAGYGRLDEDVQGVAGSVIAVTAYRRSLNGEIRAYYGPSLMPKYSTLHIGLGADYWSNVVDDAKLRHPLQETFQVAYVRAGGGFQVGNRAYFELGAKYPFSARMKEYGLDNIGLANTSVSIGGKVSPYVRFDYWLAQNTGAFLVVDGYRFKASEPVAAGTTSKGEQVTLYLPASHEVKATVGLNFKFK
jgi:hypothetical protein